MNKLITGIVIFFFSSLSFCQVAEQFLINVSCFTPAQITALYSMGIKNISTAKGQPYRVTSILATPTTKWLLATVVISSATERVSLSGWISQGKVIKMADYNVYMDYSKPFPTKVSSVTIYRDYPTDYYKIK